MKPTDTGKAYDTITDRWTSDRFDMHNGIEQHRRAITFTDNRGYALDVGCGCTGRFMDLLSSEGFTPEGIDASEKKIEISRQRSPDLSFYHDDICVWEPNKQYDFITAWDSIWHVPLEDQTALMIKLIDLLTVDGVLIFSFGGTEKPGDQTNHDMGPKTYYSSLGTNGYLELFIKNHCAIKHLEFDQHPELHTYLIVKKLA
ncbi:hypothetical protein NBRC116494_03830 [Aurantivibrio plasticivorans]